MKLLTFRKNISVFYIRRGIIGIICVFIFLMPASTVFGEGPFVAVSLNQAERMARQSGDLPEQVQELGGMTRLAGMVYDEGERDVILVGQANSSEQPINLNDLVVAMRAVMLHHEAPFVSIDPTKDTARTQLQQVRYGKGTEHTQFGKDLLAADIVLKKLALGQLSAGVWGLPSYFQLSADAWRAHGQLQNLSCRFWFFPTNLTLANQQGVIVVNDLRVAVQTEIFAGTNGPTELHDEPGEAFAAQLTGLVNDVSVVHKEVARLKPLFDLVGVVTAWERVAPVSKADYWLNIFELPPVDTLTNYDLLIASDELRRDGEKINLRIEGGVELESKIADLKDGDAGAFKSLVVKSRPPGHPFVWRVPLEGWEIEGYPDNPGTGQGSEDGYRFGELDERKIGCSLNRNILSLDGSGSVHFHAEPITSPTLAMPPPRSAFASLVRPQTISPNVGGVMLSAMARIPGSELSQTDFSEGSIALVVNGQNARLDPKAFQKFVTALWSVYYSKEDPGISIDPIAWGVDKQLVRYIGRVVNTDLGRVMREADYKMKSMAVGIEQPKTIPGFKSVDEWCGTKGMNYADAFRRFWFTPTNMKFKASDNALIFDSGKMIVQTEYMLQNQPTRAVECDQQFSDFFTDHYGQIAKEYPIYVELFEYAKLVSLAKYLKEKGIPLQWFLLANLDQVLTENSQGAVDTLSKGSKFLKDFRIEGGVEMPGKYVLDETAATAIQQAMSRLGPQQRPSTSLGHAQAPQAPLVRDRSFEFEKHNYSIVPQHSLTCGKDLHGVRYQTDIALHDTGEPGLELVRYFSPSTDADEPAPADFGKGWRLLIPFRAIPLGVPSKQLGNVLVTEKWLIKNLLNGHQEVLTYDETNFALAGYRPANITNSQFLGMFWTGGGFLRLGDKIGNEFWFDSSGILREMHFSEDYGVRYEYDFEEAGGESFHEAPFELSVVGTNVERGFTVDLPSRLMLSDRVTGHHETFHFGTNENDDIGYLSDNIVLAQKRFIALRQDGTQVVEEPNGNEIWFDLNREFVKQRNLVITRMAQGHYQWSDSLQDLEFVENHSVKFNHELADGKFIINSADLCESTNKSPILTVNYDYDKDWMLAGVSSSRRKEVKK